MSPSPVPPAVRSAVDELASAFGDNLRAVLWFGSTARGEGNLESDEDVLLILRTVDEDALRRVHRILSVGEREALSVDVRGEQELRRLPYDRAYLRFVFGFRVLYGEFAPLPLPRQALLAVLYDLTSETSRACRHRFMEERRPTKRVRGLAKRALVALKARQLLLHGVWPETATELAQGLRDAEEQEIIGWVARWPEAKSYFSEDPDAALLRIDALMRKMIEELPPSV